MQSFFIQTLGCKVNQYESEQIATLLRSRGLRQVDSPAAADLRIVNSCSVTTEAAAKSRNATRRMIRLPQFQHQVSTDLGAHQNSGGRIIVTGCWATSNKAEATNLLDGRLGENFGGRGGVDAVLTHNDNVAHEIDRLLERWHAEEHLPQPDLASDEAFGEPLSAVCAQGSDRNEGIMNVRVGAPRPELPADNKPHESIRVKQNSESLSTIGTRALPLLDARHAGHQRAFMKIQDGCDAHCTYCIIPNLRRALWSKSIDDAVLEANQLVAAGHREIVLTGIFLGAYAQPTAIRRRQPTETAHHFANLIDALCTKVPDLGRLRLSSLEPGDMTDDLLKTLKAHKQIVPHFHLPLQSGSDTILRKMNRQYTRDDFLRMIDRVNESFDRPAITTDIITGFPGESEAEFAQTLDIVDRAKFIHIHAFPFSARPGTAAARWTKDFVRPRIATARIEELTARSAACGFAFRQSFLNEEVELLVERSQHGPTQHGRCERYFDVHFEHDEALVGKSVRVRIDRVSPQRTFGQVISIGDDR